MTDKSDRAKAEEARLAQEEAERQRQRGKPTQLPADDHPPLGGRVLGGKNLGGAPTNKDAARQRSTKDGEAEEIDYAQGTVHEMEEQMKADALKKKAPAEALPQGRVVHLMEVEMKGEAVADYIESNPHVDVGLPEPEEPPLPGKPPEPPLGGGNGKRGR